jgi:hypothetical protein
LPLGHNSNKNVVRGEGDELATAPERSAEEAEGVERVGKMSKEHLDSYTARATNFLHAEHERHSRQVVSIAAPKEEFGELHFTPPPRDRAHPEGVLDEDADGYNLSGNIGGKRKVGLLYCILLGSGLAFALGFGVFW